MATSKRFERVYIEITNVCNLQCHFCPEVDRPAKRMALPLFQTVIEQVRDHVDEVTLHVMGEPLAHPEFVEFVNECSARQVPIQLTTNGTLLAYRQGGGPSRAEILLNPIFRQINFSLQSFPANTRQTETARAAGFDEYMKEIFRFTRRAMRERSDLYINYRLWNLGSAEASINQNQKFLQPIQSEFGYELKSPVAVGLPQTRGSGFRKSWRIAGRLYLHFDSRFEWPNLQRSVLHTEGTCHALRSHCAILSDGAVVPCCLDKEAGIHLGRLSEDAAPGAFLAIVNSERARRIRAGFDRGELCEGLCQRCGFISRFRSGQKARTSSAARVEGTAGDPHGVNIARPDPITTSSPSREIDSAMQKLNIIVIREPVNKSALRPFKGAAKNVVNLHQRMSQKWLNFGNFR
jgi:hypothetical protein